MGCYTWAAALAVPEMLCVSGDVALTCITVTSPMAKPVPPKTVIAPQKTGERSLLALSMII